MMRKQYIPLVIMVALLIGPLSVQAQGRRPGQGQGRNRAGQDTTITVPADSLHAVIARLNARLARLEGVIEAREQAARRQALRDRARQRAAGGGGGEQAVDPRSVTFYGRQRQLNQLNPEISMTGDFIGVVRSPQTPTTGTPYTFWDGMDFDSALGYLPSGNRFFMRAAEFNVVAPLDPFTRGKFFLEIPGDGSLALDEAYMQWVSQTHLKIGLFRNEFGQLNRWHEHGLPQVDRPHVLTTFFNEAGLEGLGVSANWVLGRLWAHVNELTLEYVSGGDGISFAGGKGHDRVAVARLKNYYDISGNAYFEVGLSGAQGANDPAGDYLSTIGGIDLNYSWSPAGRRHYRSFEVRAEALYSSRETPLGTQTAWGGYLSAQNRFSARLLGSVRFDYTQLPWDPDETIRGIAATLDFWQSEFVFFRIQADSVWMSFADSDTITRVLLQTVWSMGPHKHEAY